jgi:hypothetical protein
MTSSLKIRELNDQLRRSILSPLGQWVFTPGITERGPDFVAQAVSQVTAFSAFTSDNDPYGEHDFGSVEVGGVTVFWKIDYYDLALAAGSEDPADPTQTRRVLTLMLASEY